ncbi:acetylcholine receptor subunit alpha-type acr-16-like [Clavelina lepadiformis]|uniref:acetylcholine receptor subunit alpha-type acr-16-like n=1 Tax=Clavelina lepadiformis TaxID=159417 RepID=UPI004041C9B1
MKNLVCIVIVGIVFQTGILTGKSDPVEQKLISDKLSNCSILERPVVDHNQPLIVKIKFTLQQIIDVDERNQILTTNAWLDLKWNNYLWKWNKEVYGNITKTRIPHDQIWTPDILLYNSADAKFDPTTHTHVVVDSTGDCLYVPPGIFKSTCKIDVSNFPFDEQKCKLKFGIWSYNGNQVDLQLQSNQADDFDIENWKRSDGVDITEYTESGEWKLTNVTAQRKSLKYKCCPEKYVDVSFTLVMRRRTMFFVMNLILPCILNSVLTLITFFLPAAAAEKITLAITVLLAQIVFMLLIMETMPPTSDAMPLISKYFACSLIAVCASVAGTVLVLSFHYTSPEIDGRMSPALKKFLLYTAPKWMRMKPYSPKTFRLKKSKTVSKASSLKQPSPSKGVATSWRCSVPQRNQAEVSIETLLKSDKKIKSKRSVEHLTREVVDNFVLVDCRLKKSLKSSTSTLLPK